MADCIEREAVLKFIENGLNNPDREKAFGYDAVEIMSEVRYMPAAEVAPVVFCRNCVAHKHCAAERIYLSEGIEAPFCCRGKRRSTDGYHTSILIVDELDAGRKYNNDSR